MPFPRFLLALAAAILSTTPALATPQLTVEVSSTVLTPGATLTMALDAPIEVTDPPLQFDAPEDAIDVAFPFVTPGTYVLQFSPDGDFFSDATSPIVHPSPGTLTINHDPGPVVTAFYRLARLLDACHLVTLRNTGDTTLTGITPAITNDTTAAFTLDTSLTATSLDPGESTTFTVCFTAEDTSPHHASLDIASNDPTHNPFPLQLLGTNAPGPIQTLPEYRLFGVTWDHPGSERLCVVDTATGTATPVSATRINKLLGIAWDDPSQTLYATTTHASSPARALVEIDPPTGATTAQHSVGFESFPDAAEGDVAVQPSTGLVFCLISGGAVQVWDPATASLAYSFQIPAPQLFNDYSGLAFDPTGNLFTIDPNSFTDDPTGIPELHRIDPSDGAILETIPLSSSLGVVMGLAFHPQTGDAFVADSCDAEPAVGQDTCDGFTLYHLAVSTGQLTAVGPTGVGLCGLTFMPGFTPLPPTPEIRVTGPVGEVTSGQSGVFQFDANPFGGGTAHSFDLHNDGNLEPLVLSAVSLPTGFVTSLAPLPISIEPGRSRTLTISCTGPAQGVYQGEVVLTTNDPDESPFTFPVRALFNMPELQVLDPFNNDLASGATLDLGTTLLGQKKNALVRIRNLHAGTLTVTGISLPTGYTLGQFAPTFPFSLARNGLTDIPFQLTADNPGTVSGTLTLSNNDDDESPFQIQLTATVSPESIHFFGFNTFIPEGESMGASAFGTGPVTYQWDLDGDGEFDDAVGASFPLPDSDGPGTFEARLKMTDDLTSMVRTATVPIENTTPRISSSLPGIALAATPVTLAVSAIDAPTDLAAGVAWRIDWGDGTVVTTPAGHPATTTFQHAYALPGQQHLVDIQATDKDGATGQNSLSVWVASAVIAVHDGPDTSAPELLDGTDEISFSTTLGVPVDHPLTLHNRSASTASVGPVTLPAGFTLLSPPAFPLTLAPDDSVTLTVRFGAESFGEQRGTLSIATSDPDMPAFDLALVATVAAPDIAVSVFDVEAFDFATGTRAFTVQPGTASFNGLSVRIENSDSSVPLEISAIDLPPNFQLSTTSPTFPLTLSSDGASSTDLRIQCNATATGVYKGWVSILSDDPDENPFRFFVTCRVGDVPDLLVKSDSSGADSATGIVLNGQPDPLVLPDTGLQLHLHNQGSTTLTVSTITLPDGFAFASPPAFPITLSFFATTTLPDILLTATTPGTHTGTVSITSTDPDENPYTFPITATIADDTPLEPVPTSFTFTTDGTVSLAFTGRPGQSYTLLRSTDLLNWQIVTTTTAGPDGTLAFTDPDAPTDRIFYQLVPTGI